jgi:Family of unknown function (DUF5681)
MSDNNEYAVGYRRPPKETRFKPGNSASRGRRRKPERDMSFPAIIDRMLARRVKNGDGSRSLTMQELITRQMFKKAADGDPAAAKVLKRLKNLKRENTKPKERKHIFRIIPNPKKS